MRHVLPDKINNKDAKAQNFDMSFTNCREFKYAEGVTEISLNL
jgi:hypothetical protein